RTRKLFCWFFEAIQKSSRSKAILRRRAYQCDFREPRFRTVTGICTVMQMLNASEPRKSTRKQRSSKPLNRIARPILVSRRHLNMIDDENRDGACLRFQF